MNDGWLDELPAQADRNQLQGLLPLLRKKLDDPRWHLQREAVARLGELRASELICDEEVVSFRREAPLTTEEHQLVKHILDDLRPWKKGPFHILGHDIDAEWRSDQKWGRLADKVGSLDGQWVADIGCHNGYFMYRMLAHGAKRVLGFEPFAQLYFTFSLFNQLYPRPELAFELLGVEHLDLFTETFDTIFCLGILYHHTDPVGLLRKMRQALRPKGRIFIDCQGLPGDEAYSLTPKSRYAGAGGVWFVPTLKALEHWVLRAGFSRCECIYSAPLSIEEQRATPWAPVKSLSDFLDPSDPTRTIEGYPAPWRHYLLIRP